MLVARDDAGFAGRGDDQSRLKLRKFQDFACSQPLVAGEREPAIQVGRLLLRTPAVTGQMDMAPLRQRSPDGFFGLAAMADVALDRDGELGEVAVADDA